MERRDFLALLGLGAAERGDGCLFLSDKRTYPFARPIVVDLSDRSGRPSVEQARAGDDVALDDIREPCGADRARQTVQLHPKNVRVGLVTQNSYAGTLAAYTRALSSGTLPNLVQMDSTYLQSLIDSHEIVPAQNAVVADHYDLSDFLPAATESFTVSGKLWALPFNCSTQVLYYDRSRSPSRTRPRFTSHRH